MNVPLMSAREAEECGHEDGFAELFLWTHHEDARHHLFSARHSCSQKNPKEYSQITTWACSNKTNSSAQRTIAEACAPVQMCERMYRFALLPHLHALEWNQSRQHQQLQRLANTIARAISHEDTTTRGQRRWRHRHDQVWQVHVCVHVHVLRVPSARLVR